MSPPETWQSFVGGRPAQRPLRAIAVGNRQCAEFAAAAAELAARVHVEWAADLGAAVQACASEPDFIVLFAARPGEVSERAIDRLRGAAPLARLIAVTSAWHEGETRTGHPWPGALRIHWCDLSRWLERELKVLEDGQCGDLALAVTATEEERLLHVSRRELRAAARQNIGVFATNRATRSLLADSCRIWGHEVTILDAERDTAAPISTGLFDAAAMDPEACRELAHLTSCWPGVSWIVVASFPRVADRHRAMAAGATEVLAKPLRLDNLAAAIDLAVLQQRKRS